MRDQIERHMDIAEQLTKTYAAKNEDYGDAFDKSLDNHGLTAAIIRMEDKMGRFSNLAGRPASMQVDESLEDTLLDLANYAIMTVMWVEKQTVNLYADNKAYTMIHSDKVLTQKEIDDINAKADKVVANFDKKMDAIMNDTKDKVLADVKSMEPKGGYHEAVGFVPDEDILFEYSMQSGQYTVTLGKTTWGSYDIDDDLYIKNTLHAFKHGQINATKAWEHIQRFIVTK